MTRQTREHEGELTIESKEMIGEGYEFVSEDTFVCICGARVSIRRDAVTKQFVPLPHKPAPRPKALNTGKSGRKR